MDRPVSQTTDWSLFLHHDHLPWTLDATEMGLDPAALDGLDWSGAIADMMAAEAGDIVNIDEKRMVGHYWLRRPPSAPNLGIATAIGEAANAVRSFAARVRAGEITSDAGQAFTDVVHVGIGGSQLGPALVVDALGDDPEGCPRGLSIHFCDNTDPDGVARVVGRLGDRLTTTLVVVVTKSGSTPEPRNALALVRRAMDARGIDTAKHLVAITVEGSKLDALAAEEGWLAVFPIWPWVGGRYSVTSAVGLLPAELAGIDTEALLEGAATMDDWTRTRDWRDNPAALLSGSWYLAGEGQGTRAQVVLPYADRLVLMSRYLQQLVMESLGKRLDRNGAVVHQGITVYGNKGSTDQHAYVQQLRDGRDDFFVTFIQVLKLAAADPDLEDGVGAGDYLQGFLLGTRRALAEGGRRSLTITVPEVDERVVGGLIALFERAVGLYGSLIDINAYHQPGVEAGKKAAAKMLSLSRAVRQHLQNGPARTEELAAAVSGDLLEVHYVLLRLEATGRIARVDGGGRDVVWKSAGA
jgi:glucose-6-phosphate isomerase